MNIFIDIDHTICNTHQTDYSNATPIQYNIDKVNQFYNAGHSITMWTARGTMTGVDWTQITLEQLNKWGVKYHKLQLGKPAFDLFIDDKVLNTDHWTEENVNKILK
jgi:CMP-N,N'-diacetyllegionaminic acid synthase